MAVGSNFERLEQEVDRLLQVLDQFKAENDQLKQEAELLKQENGQLKGRLAHMENENSQFKVRNDELSRIEASYQESLRSREEAKSRIDSILARLDEVQF